ncbi:hypothetical protein GGI25_003679 [Coemansia spiralis]|uniref:Homeobox domain-containing protein n=2 Tax=Coemansia TaxID=4863 RepID=A0A9W8KXT2_9FUNG|nr:hypothetical protein BX070DRAFT_252165 [Coemansia spiralis]KAJ1991987.1 hypothetical protein EDC05_003142 [Coemansia umbellata]KAJ2625357.1 hypothetical protein GGI26_000828 [Coemansia sp. RSA 1358]KAJ2676173.1 hypothetical protein GGI25_003679 [Coemansia spiralis]
MPQTSSTPFHLSDPAIFGFDESLQVPATPPSFPEDPSLFPISSDLGCLSRLHATDAPLPLSNDYMVPGIGISFSNISSSMSSKWTSSSPQCQDNSTTASTMHASNSSSIRLRRNAVFIPRVISDSICQMFDINVESDKQETVLNNYEELNAVHSVISNCSNAKNSQKLSCRGYDSKVSAILYDWLHKHVDNPFPTSSEKKALIKETGLTKMQLKNWFCNVRRRKLPYTTRKTRTKKHFRW